jgi:hypothetical protein
VVHEVELTGVNTKVDFELSQPPATGSLLVHIEPSEAQVMLARSGGVTGTTQTWRNSGDTESDVSAGDYIVEFRNINRWKTPEKLFITVELGETAQATGIYERRTLLPGVLMLLLDDE